MINTQQFSKASDNLRSVSHWKKAGQEQRMVLCDRGREGNLQHFPITRLEGPHERGKTHVFIFPLLFQSVFATSTEVDVSSEKGRHKSFPLPIQHVQERL